MWSAIAGLVGNVGSGLLNAGIQYNTSKSLSKYNYELGQRSLQSSPGNYKKGLEAAGINPMLASNSPIGATQGSSGVNPGIDMTEGAVKGNSAKNLNAQTKSNIAFQGKQGEAAVQQAGAAVQQADAASAQANASMITAQANAEKAKAEAEYSRALTQTENAMREAKVGAKGREGKNSVFNTVEEAGKKLVGMLPSERPDSGVIHSAKSVPPDPNKTILKGKSQKEKEKWYLEQIRKNQKYINRKY